MMSDLKVCVYVRPAVSRGYVRVLTADSGVIHTRDSAPSSLTQHYGAINSVLSAPIR